MRIPSHDNIGSASLERIEYAWVGSVHGDEHCALGSWELGRYMCQRQSCVPARCNHKVHRRTAHTGAWLFGCIVDFLGQRALCSLLEALRWLQILFAYEIVLHRIKEVDLAYRMDNRSFIFVSYS